jgi:chromosome segregation ATPase
MATSIIENHCAKCKKENVILKCEGYSQRFCHNDFGNHRQEVEQQLDDIQINRDLLQQTLVEQTTEPQKQQLIQQINRWEEESINTIKKTAEETRQILRSHTNRNIRKIKLKLDNLSHRLEQSREEKDFVETNLNEWNQQLIRLKEELNKPSDVKISHDSTPLITKIYVDIFGKLNQPSKLFSKNL